MKPADICCFAPRCGRLAALLAALLLAAALASATASPSGAQRAADAGRALIGTAAPPLILTTIDGQRIDLGELYGHKACRRCC
jgi:cytochrome oxidase Cu insertion factor (SCO1/SenC/PrrC family)